MMIINLLLAFFLTAPQTPDPAPQAEPFRAEIAYGAVRHEGVGSLSFIGRQKSMWIRHQTLYPDLHPATAQKLSLTPGLTVEAMASMPAMTLCIGPNQHGCVWVYEPTCAAAVIDTVNTVLSNCLAAVPESCSGYTNPSPEYTQCLADQTASCYDRADDLLDSLIIACCEEDCGG